MKIKTYISKSLYIALQEEKEKLNNIQKRTKKKRKRRITLIDASNSIARKLR